MLTRRDACRLVSTAVAGSLFTSCSRPPTRPGAGGPILHLERRSSGPPPSARLTNAPAAVRRTVIHVPEGPGPFPLLVLFHGAGGSGEAFLDRLSFVLTETPAIVFAPTSTRETWDALRAEPWTLLDMATGRARRTGFGADLDAVNGVLEEVVGRGLVNTRRVCLAGFSDGATYALSLALANGLAVPRVVAFSPGFVLPVPRVGRPAVFISHGRADRVLPVQRASRRIVAGLDKDGYPVEYREFDGGHEIPRPIAREAISWALG